MGLEDLEKEYRKKDEENKKEKKFVFRLITISFVAINLYLFGGDILTMLYMLKGL